MKTVSILEVPISGDVVLREIDSSLDTMQALVGGGLVQALPLTSRVSLYVNDEGLLRDDFAPNPVLTDVFGRYLATVLMGPGFLGATDENGEPSSLTSGEIDRWRTQLLARTSYRPRRS